MKLLPFATLICTAVIVGVAPEPVSAESSSPVDVELKKLFDDDQAARIASPGKVIDWSKLQLQDEARQLRVKALVASGGLTSGADYYYAAMVMQHSNERDDYLLAHDLCVIAISKGETRAKWLAAASLDRFLVAIGRAQRYGTQFNSNHPSRPPKLAPVDPSVPDSLRQELGVPTLDEAKAKERQFAEGAKPTN
jgi:hypothetical protein